MDKDLVILGLGSGGIETLTVGALEKMKRAKRLFLRTSRHPVVQQLADMGICFESFDYLYDSYGDFHQVYDEIAKKLIAEAEIQPVVYGVPGHPLVGEESVHKLIKLAGERGLHLELVPAVSFLDSVLVSLRVELSEGLKIIDGLELASGKANPLVRPDPLVSNLVMQVYNPLVASDVKLTLMEFYPDDHHVTVITAAGVPGSERVEKVPLYELDRLNWIDHLTCVYVPVFNESRSMVSRFPLDMLVDILEHLRDDNGCPWDREQTHESLKKYLVEETYEVLDAIDEGNMYKVCEELGDLLLQVAFHAQIARESGFFDINDVVKIISEKLVRRHPHVFGETSVTDSKEVSVNWEAIKKEELAEKGEIRKSLLDGIPQNMPALMKADKIQRKAAKVGFDWPDYQGALQKVEEEKSELEAVILENSNEKIRDEMGDLLFAVVNLARLLNLDAEETLTGAVRKFKERFILMEKLADEANIELRKMDLAALDRLWEEAKIQLKGKNS